MVVSPEPAPPRPFALRAFLYTLGFLLVVLGVIPSVFYLVGEMPLRQISFWDEARVFWISFRQLVGIALFGAGLTAYCLCSAWLIFVGRGPHVEFDPPKVFVASGPYRWVRNPVVICLLLTVLGQAVFLASLGLFVLVGLGMFFAQYQVTRIEEPRLRERFGDAYTAYCNRVPRWLPKPPAADSATP